MNELVTARNDNGFVAPFIKADDDVNARPSDVRSHVLGLSIFAILPAIFWTAIIAAISPILFGVSLDVTVIATIGFGIAAFLAPLYGAFATGE